MGKLMAGADVQESSTANSTKWGALKSIGNLQQAKETPYPLDTMPDVIRQAIKAIADHAQVPMAMAGQCVLGTLSSIAQRHADSVYKSKHYPCSLYLLTEGSSGCGKTEAQKLADKVLADNEKASYQQYQQELTEWQNELAAAKDKAQFKALRSEPLNPSSMFADATIEPIISLMIEGRITNASWVTDECSQVFNGYSLTSDTAGNTLGTLTSLYSDGMVSRLRSQSNRNVSGKAYDVRLTFSLLGQKVVLCKVLQNDLFRQQGFLPRFLFAAPDSLVGKRDYSLEHYRNKPCTDSRLVTYWELCRQKLKHTHDDRQGIALDDDRQGIALDDDALLVWLDFKQQCEDKQQAGEPYQHIKAFASRGAENALRIATVFSFFEGKQSIDINCINSAIRLAEYSLSEWLRYSDVNADEQSDAQKLLEHIIKYVDTHSLGDRVGRSQIMSSSPKKLRRKDTFNAAIDVLQECNYLCLEKLNNTDILVLHPDVVKSYTPVKRGKKEKNELKLYTV